MSDSFIDYKTDATLLGIGALGGFLVGREFEHKAQGAANETLTRSVHDLLGEVRAQRQVMSVMGDAIAAEATVPRAMLLSKPEYHRITHDVMNRANIVSINLDALETLAHIDYQAKQNQGLFDALKSSELVKNLATRMSEENIRYLPLRPTGKAEIDTMATQLSESLKPWADSFSPKVAGHPMTARMQNMVLNSQLFDAKPASYQWTTWMNSYLLDAQKQAFAAAGLQYTGQGLELASSQRNTPVTMADLLFVKYDFERPNPNAVVDGLDQAKSIFRRGFGNDGFGMEKIIGRYQLPIDLNHTPANLSYEFREYASLFENVAKERPVIPPLMTSLPEAPNALPKPKISALKASALGAAASVPLIAGWEIYNRLK